jgi:hypothetical protein
VIYHLIEDKVFTEHMNNLFERASRFVIIYASNRNSSWPDEHVRHRRFSDHVTKAWPEWQLRAHVPNPYPYDRMRTETTSFADFYVYGRATEGCLIRLPSAQPYPPGDPGLLSA